jgi:hypothetical protein
MQHAGDGDQLPDRVFTDDTGASGGPVHAPRYCFQVQGQSRTTGRAGITRKGELLLRQTEFRRDDRRPRQGGIGDRQALEPLREGIPDSYQGMLGTGTVPGHVDIDAKVGILREQRLRGLPHHPHVRWCAGWHNRLRDADRPRSGLERNDPSIVEYRG